MENFYFQAVSNYIVFSCKFKGKSEKSYYSFSLTDPPVPLSNQGEMAYNSALYLISLFITVEKNIM